MSPQLAAEWADREQAALAEADRKYHDIHGDDETEWSALERGSYLDLIATIHGWFHGDEFEVAA